MNSVRVDDAADTIRVISDHWEIEHLKRAGGAWNSLVFTHGSKKNMLRGPASSAVRLVRSDPLSEDPQGYYAESNDSSARVSVEQGADGCMSVIAEGTYRNVNGDAVPVGFRRRTDYCAHGIIWTTLQIMSDCGCPGAVEVRGLGLPLRAGLTHAFARFHPTQAGSSDLLGGRTWLDLARGAQSTPFLSRFTPLQLSCFERGVEGLEIFPGSELAQWDCSFKPDAGLGNFSIGHDAHGTSIELDPYCLAFRRVKIRLQGTVTLRLGMALSEVKPRAAAAKAVRHVFISTPHTTDAQIEQLAAEGVELVCFRDDYRDGGAFWRNGAVAPYNAEGMAALHALIESCHRCSIQIVPYIATHELHPATHAYDVHARDWMHSAARSLDVIHTWSGQGELGGLMCLRSGWLDYRKKTIDAILNNLPWDGLCLDWPSPTPCCHPGHASGSFHSDVEELIDLLSYCRQRVGENGALAFLASNDSSILAANLADHILPRDAQAS